MTKGEMRAEVARRLAEVGGRVFWSDDDINTAVNDGLMELADATEFNEASLEIDLREDRPFYDLRTLVGPTFLSLKPTFDPQTNRWLIPSSVAQMDTRDRRWEYVTGEPQRIFMRGLWWLGLFPRIQAEVGSLKLYHTALPAPLDDDADEPAFPDTFHMGCVAFAVADLWAQDGETARCLVAWAEYLVVEAQLDAWVQGRAAAPLMHGIDSPRAGAAR